MSQIRVERFCARGHKKDSTQDDERVPAMHRKKPDSVKGINGGKDFRRGHHLSKARDCKYQEPHQHYWAKKLCDRFGALSLQAKEANQDQKG